METVFLDTQDGVKRFEDAGFTERQSNSLIDVIGSFFKKYEIDRKEFSDLREYVKNVDTTSRVGIANHKTTTVSEISNMRTEMHGMRTELKDEINELRTEMHGMRTELKDEINELRTELKGEVNDLRTELKGEINNLRTELKGEINDLRVETISGFKGIENSIQSTFRTMMMWMVGTQIAAIGIVVGIVLGLLQ